ncbi:MAG: hypothetical protein ACRDNI_02950 [Gaiellaceae bacterium]
MASKKKNAEAILKAKEAKQKKLLIFLAPVFLGLAVWQGPKMYSAFFSAPPAPEEAAPATPAPADPTQAPPPAAPADGEVPPPGGLEDTDLAPVADVTKLLTFSRFTGRDPFLVPPGAPGSSESSSGGGSGGGSTGGSGSGSGGSSGSGGEVAGTAVLEVNGATETVSIGEEFPTADPTFTLVSISEDGVVIGVVQGMFEDGSATTEIALGERVVLIAAPETTEFTIELVDVTPA